MLSVTVFDAGPASGGAGWVTGCCLVRNNELHGMRYAVDFELEVFGRMTIISHKHKFIFVRPHKVASGSILISLSSLCGDDDVFCIGPNEVEYRPDRDDDDFGVVQAWNNDIFADLTLKEGRRNGHILPGIIHKKVGDSVWNEYFKFTVVRNPWDWYMSFYWWNMYKFLEGKIEPVRATAPKASIYYIRRHWRRIVGRSRTVRPVNKEVVEQSLKGKWFEGTMAMWPRFYFMDGMPYADCYLRFEHLQGDFDRMRQRLGLPAGVLPRTKSRVRPKGVDYRDYYTDWSRDYIGRRFREIVDAFGYSF